MATPLREILDFLDDIGVFEVVLPFLLVFAIVFALLERTKVFGIEEIEGKKYTKKNLNSIAAFVISILVVGSSHLVEIITEVASNFVVLLIGIVLFLLLVGSFFQEKQEGVFLEGGWKTAFMAVVVIILAFIFLDALNLIDSTFDFFGGNSRGEVGGTIVLIILVVLFIGYITQERKIEKKS